jgi:hypothetical protein
MTEMLTDGETHVRASLHMNAAMDQIRLSEDLPSGQVTASETKAFGCRPPARRSSARADL